MLLTHFLSATRAITPVFDGLSGRGSGCGELQCWRAMTAILFIAQRVSAAVLAFFVTVHLATILYATRGGLTAGEVLARTRDNHWFFAFYVLFVLAVSTHAPIGLRNVIREWTPWQGRSLDIALAIFALILLSTGFRAAAAVYLPPEALLQ